MTKIQLRINGKWPVKTYWSHNGYRIFWRRSCSEKSWKEYRGLPEVNHHVLFRARLGHRTVSDVQLVASWGHLRWCDRMIMLSDGPAGRMQFRKSLHCLNIYIVNQWLITTLSKLSSECWFMLPALGSLSTYTHSQPSARPCYLSKVLSHVYATTPIGFIQLSRGD